MKEEMASGVAGWEKGAAAGKEERGWDLRVGEARGLGLAEGEAGLEMAVEEGSSTVLARQLRPLVAYKPTATAQGRPAPCACGVRTSEQGISQRHVLGANNRMSSPLKVCAFGSLLVMRRRRVMSWPRPQWVETGPCPGQKNGDP